MSINSTEIRKSVRQIVHEILILMYLLYSCYILREHTHTYAHIYIYIYISHWLWDFERKGLIKFMSYLTPSIFFKAKQQKRTPWIQISIQHFHFSAMVNGAAMSVGIHVSLKNSYPVDKYSEEKFQCNVVLTFSQWHPYCFPQFLHKFTFLLLV